MMRHKRQATCLPPAGGGRWINSRAASASLQALAALARVSPAAADPGSKWVLSGGLCSEHCGTLLRDGQQLLEGLGFQLLLLNRLRSQGWDVYPAFAML
jgi:hypothetical protein